MGQQASMCLQPAGDPPGTEFEVKPGVSSASRGSKLQEVAGGPPATPKFTTTEEVAKAAEQSSSNGMDFVQKAMHGLQTRFPYLDLPEHHLNPWLATCMVAVQANSAAEAIDTVTRIEQLIEQEENTLSSAFALFKPAHKDSLSKEEVRNMLAYLAFPCTTKDVQAVIKATDRDGDEKMGLDEFQLYVGRMGGTYKLFEQRRKQLKGSEGGDAELAESEDCRIQLLQAGFDESSQSYWKLIVGPSEFQEAMNLVKAQRQALRHIRSLAKSNHEAKLPLLQQRVKQLKYKDTDLWMTLAWIREQAPIIVHLNLDKMMQYLEKDTHYRNQFETASSGGLMNPKVRKQWEQKLFGGFYDDAQAFDKCKYGVVNAMNDHRGVVGCAQYGDSYVILKDVRLRTTLSPEDSANLKASQLAVLDYYAHVLYQYTDAELVETIKVAINREDALLGDSSKIGKMKYKEAQIHGEICWSKHVARLVCHTRHKKDKTRLEKICAKHGWTMSWQDEERERMKADKKLKLGKDAWAETLAKVEMKTVRSVAEGFCRSGCGRPVAPGKTPAGNAFTTCCRGCALGFGHDRHCGVIDEAKIGEGLCKYGCGRGVMPGQTPSGQKWQTCCRLCHTGRHTKRCGGGSTSPAGICIQCKERTVAEGTDKRGNVYKSCCKACVTSGGKRHDITCAGPLSNFC
mmetsp:Transcript_48380/g.89075  ORF Transcript_48380/g.89075 Transcript_48380/m.89075 type:complete len:683 (+) Transcript_48380:89-2137(+)